MLDWPAEDTEIKEYEGERNDSNQRHGQGRALLPNGDVYEGKYRNGKRHGSGLYVFRGGSRYEGQWKKGVKQGEGKFYYPDGSWYEGTKQPYKLCQPGEFGTTFYTTHLDAGEWKRDMRHGYGAYHYPNGDVYEGSWRKNLRHGLGNYTYQSSGTKFMGSWVNERMEGPGQLIHPEHRYHGTWGKNLVRDTLSLGAFHGTGAWSLVRDTLSLGAFIWDRSLVRDTLSLGAFCGTGAWSLVRDTLSLGAFQEPGERYFVTRGFLWDRSLVRDTLSLGAFQEPEGTGVYTFSLKWMQLGRYVHMKVSDQELAEALDEERAEESTKDPSAIPRGVVALWRATKVSKYDPSLLPAEPVPVTIMDSVQSIESVEPPEEAGEKQEDPPEEAGEKEEEKPEEPGEKQEEPPEEAGEKEEETPEEPGEKQEDPPEAAGEKEEEPQTPEQVVQDESPKEAERLTSQEIQEDIQPETVNVEPKVSAEDNPETEEDDF
uniref:Radial spoke head 1 homolog n=1 Tax=Timema genevievae TaxID=629358 RepID=A0A7R9JVN5_TIMGE|nr:unnamed protein product [Timema genevievae]